MLRIFVQARMSSRRFPGKMLATMAGRPLVAHVLGQCAKAFGASHVVLATSTDDSDAPLAELARQLGFAVFRGSLGNVVLRFQDCLREYPCEWLVRVSGDSPFIDPALIERVAAHRANDIDLVTNVQTRTFPPGQSVEVIRGGRFAELPAAALDAREQEHVTLHYYRRPREFRIRALVSSDPGVASGRFVVDTPEDLRRLEALASAGSMPGFAHLVALAPA